MNVLVLYSWEENESNASEWAMALCNELQKYECITAYCDKLWSPQSDTKFIISNKILEADKLVIIVSKSYNEKILNEVGMVSFEEKIYREIIKNDKYGNDSNKILFVLKEADIDLPVGWMDFNRVDLSKFNRNEYNYLSPNEKEELIVKVIRNLMGIPEYELNTCRKKKNLPKSKKAKSFEMIFANPNRRLSLKEQERRLIDYLYLNRNQESMIYDYLRSGVAADLNFNGKITPELFYEFFLVRRDDNEEGKYNRIIQDVFHSSNHNLLCLQSDGGSGKSVFVQTLCQRLEQNSRTKYNYNTVVFDLSNLQENSLTKEELVFQRLKKEYRQMVRCYKDNISYAKNWINNFSEVINRLKEVAFDNGDSLFKLAIFQEELNNAISQISPVENMEENDLEDWYIGFSKRIYNARSRVNDSNILFIILLVIYMLILTSKPKIHKTDRYIFVFDNIETYDNGETTKEIANYIQHCHSFIKSTFRSLGNPDLFYTKFTFVFIIRTSTRAHFGNLQTDVWGGGRYVKTLTFFDFTIEALIKKIKFLTKMKDYRNSLLFKELYLIASTIIPPNVLNNCLNKDSINIIEYKQFTTNSLLPLFNNDYRKTVKYICNILSFEDNHDNIRNKIKEINGLHGVLYDYSINGVRMIIIRKIFDYLQENGYLDTMGFSDLSGTEEHSVTRMIISYLYWNEYNHVLSKPSKEYKGVSLYSVIDTFRYFCSSKELTEILYGLSMYASKDYLKKEALEAWGFLLTYTNLNVDLTENELESLINEFYLNKQNSINIQNINIRLDKIYVKLSDAGMCFAQYYLRNFEFLSSRSRSIHNESPLFMLINKDTIRSCIDNLYNIVINCINKLIARCQNICVLYGKEKDKCILNNTFNTETEILSCSLFIRYQECVDLIKESIDYIDRFRIVFYNNCNDKDINNILLDEITKYYKLYETLEKKILENSNNKCMKKFLRNWNYPWNSKFQIIKNTDSSDKTDKDNKTRITRIRPIQSYYVKADENFTLALQEARTKPNQTIYGIIENMYKK